MEAKRQYHIDLCAEDIKGAKYAIVAGDPERVPGLAKAFDVNAVKLTHHRGYVSYLTHCEGKPILVATLGIGGPSASIVIEELANIGIEYFIRVGTCGAIQPNINLGDLVVTKAAVRLDGASKHYAPIEYPAVASFHLTEAIVRAARELQIPYHLGITASTDTFYPGQERYDNHNQYVLRSLQGSLKEWQKLNVLNFEMESATLLTLANVFGLHAACFCGVMASRVHSETPRTDVLDLARANWEKVMVRAVALHMQYVENKGSML